MGKSKTYKIYCDESRQTGYKYMLLGGIWILKDKGWDFVNEFENCCCKEIGLPNPMAHMKWTKVPTKPIGKYYDAYKRLIDLYFEYNSKGIMKYRAIIIDRELFDLKHEAFYDGDYETGFYSLYCQLLLNWIQKSNQYEIRIASRNIKKKSIMDDESLRLLELKNKLDNKLIDRLYRYTIPTAPFISPIKNIESRPASDRRLIQLADIITGAIGFHWNNEHRKQKVRKGKLYLAEHIANKAGKPDLYFQTGWKDETLNVFYFDTSKSRYRSHTLVK